MLPALLRYAVIALMLLSVGTAAAIREAEAPAAPDFTVTTYSGETISLSDYAGTPLIVHFWATFVPDSLEDIALLDSIARESTPDELGIIGINHFDTDEAARAFIVQADPAYPLAPDPEGAVAISYDITTLPKTFLITAEGTIQEAIPDALVDEDFRISLAALLGEAPETQIETAAPLPAGVMDRYSDLPQSTTEEGFPVLGAPESIVTIEDFSSFSCGFCRDFHDDIFPELVEKVRQGDVSFVYVPIYSTGAVDNGLTANRAAMCAAEQNRFWEYAETLFHWHTRYNNDTAFNDERLRGGAEAMDLDMGQWDACMASERPNLILDAALERFRDAGYTGTPTIIINGEAVRANLSAIEDRINRILGDRT